MRTDKHGWIDVSVPIRSEMPTWPDDPRAWVQRVLRLEDGDPANVSVLSITTHTGTHLDPPLHFLEEGDPIDAMDPTIGLGPAHVVEVDDLETVKPEHLDGLPDAAERVLFKTDNSIRCWQTDGFVPNYVYLAEATAKALADRGTRLVGIDYLSVGGIEDNIEAVHEILLGDDVWILEGLDLSGVDPGRYELACLPIRVQHGDGAPARAMLRPLEAG